MTTPSDREVVITRTFDAPRRLVWEAWTRPELVAKWLHGWDDWRLEVREMDVRPGGALRWIWHGPKGEQMGLRGVYREVVPPERLVHTRDLRRGLDGGRDPGHAAPDGGDRAYDGDDDDPVLVA